MLLPVQWGNKIIIEPMLFRFIDANWLRRTTLRELLLHVLKEDAPINHANLDMSSDIAGSLPNNHWEMPWG